MESKFGLRMLALALVFATSCFFTGCEVSVASGNPRDYFVSKDDVQYFPPPEGNKLKEETEKLKKARKEAIEAKKQKQLEMDRVQSAP